METRVWNPETCLPIMFLVDSEEEEAIAAKARPDAMEELMLQINASEANWWLDDRLALLWSTVEDDPALD